jgi:hypothetical protein
VAQPHQQTVLAFVQQPADSAAACAEQCSPPLYRTAARIIADPSDGDRQKHTISTTSRSQACPSPTHTLASRTHRQPQSRQPVARGQSVRQVVPRAWTEGNVLSCKCCTLERRRSSPRLDHVLCVAHPRTRLAFHQRHPKLPWLVLEMTLRSHVEPLR